MPRPPSDLTPPSRDDLRRLEARIGTRFIEVNARLTLHDGRFAGMSDRLQQAEQRVDTVAAQANSQLRAADRRANEIDSRIDAVDGRIEDWRTDLLAGLATTAGTSAT